MATLKPALAQLLKKFPERPASLSEEEDRIRRACEASFYAFVREAWPHVEGHPYRDGWHVRAICDHLEALCRGDIKRLLLNQPPRTSKSSLCAVMYPAWLFLKDPGTSIMAVSYSKQLTVRDSTKCRRLIQSSWYRKLWPRVRLSADENQKTFFSTTRGGYRIATSTGAATTGFGASLVLCDDPDSITDLPSKTYRENNTTYFDEVLSTRHSGDPSRFRMLVVQQRAHSQDISGHILSKQDDRWIHLRLPMEFDATDVCTTVPLYDPVSRRVKLWRDPRKIHGEILWPEMLTPEDVRLMKEKDFRGNPYVIAGQLQQRPVPKGGGIFRDEWFQIWNHAELPDMDMIIQSWDTAFSSGSSSACSAMLTLGVFKNHFGVRNVFLLSAYQDRLEFPELKQMAQRLYHNIYDVNRDQPLHWKSAHRPDVILVEGKASGYSLIQEMERMNLPVTRFEPARYGDKESRARRVADVVENGMIWLNSNKTGDGIPDSFGQMLLKETSVFPAGETMDMVDAFSQGLIYLKDRNILYFHGPAVTGPDDDLLVQGASF